MIHSPSNSRILSISYSGRRWLPAIVYMTVWLFFGSVIEGKAGDFQTSGPGSFSPLVKKAGASVVNISAVRIVKQGEETLQPFGSNDPFQEFFDHFFRHQIPQGSRQNSLGTGFIIDEEGFILTNNHVVEQTKEIKVILADNREYNAEIVGRDPLTDLALIRFEAEHPLVSLPLGDSDSLEVGDWVVAIGNPFGLGHTVSAGIVSAMYRKIGSGPYENYIQTDAPINPGNSGGPLLNTAGEVVGITTLIFLQSGGNIGIGFAIPINMAAELLPQLKKGNVVRGWIGIMVQRLTPELKDNLKLKDEKGTLVADVLESGPAGSAGIRRGDVIVSFDGKKIMEANELPHLVASGSVGKAAIVEVIRFGQKQIFQVMIKELREDMETASSTGELREDTVSGVSSIGRPELGMILQQITPVLASKYELSRTNGLLVVGVDFLSEASEAGVEAGDIILEVDQVPVMNLIGFIRKVEKYRADQTVLLLVDREGTTLFLTIRVR